MICPACHLPIAKFVDRCNTAPGVTFHRGPACCPQCALEVLDKRLDAAYELLAAIDIYVWDREMEQA